MNVYKRITTVSRTIVAATVLAAPIAQASQSSYVAFLDDNGVAYSDVLGVIALGKSVCHELRNGISVWAIGRHLTGPLGYSGAEAGAIVLGAVGEMCPDAEPALREQVSSTAAARFAQVA